MFNRIRKTRTIILNEFALISIDIKQLRKHKKVFIFDNYGPDGPAVLDNFPNMKDIVRLGPPDKWKNLKVILYLIKKVACPDITAKQISKLQNIVDKEIFVGSSENHLLEFFDFGKNILHELQHGCLDLSYFSSKRSPHYFHALNDHSKAIYKTNCVSNTVVISYGHVHTSASEKLVSCDLKEIHLYSKNPGGQCTLESVQKLEHFLLKYCHSKNIKLKIFIHPRDRLIKFLIRNNNYIFTAFLSYIARSPKCLNGVLVVTSFSTALFDKVGSINRSINVDFGEHDEVQAEVYSDFRCVAFTELAPALDDILF